MADALSLHRFHFAFTATYHYLFPQLTMGLALLLVLVKTIALRTGDEVYDESARFLAKIFGINFAFGVVTGIPMEFQFGTNWAQFSKSAGGVIGQTLAMEGVFAFFLESSFLGLFLYGEKKMSPKAHWWTAFLVFLGSWISGYFIIVTNAWMQHPVGFVTGPDGQFHLESLSALLLNPWAFWQYLHNMNGAVITGAFFVSAVGAYYLLSGKFEKHGRVMLKMGVWAGLISSILQVFPTGDRQGAMVARHQPTTLAAMEGLFETRDGAPLAILGQPDMEKKRLDNPLVVPKMLSFLTYKRWNAEVKGLDAYPPETWPGNIPLLYFSYRIMVGLGTLFIALMVLSAWALRRGTLFENRALLWALMLALPFPYIANTAGWMTAELGRQPWIIYGLQRTADGVSAAVSSGNALFTLIGFMGMYTVLSILFLFMMAHEISHGPVKNPKGAN